MFKVIDYGYPVTAQGKLITIKNTIREARAAKQDKVEELSGECNIRIEYVEGMQFDKKITREFMIQGAKDGLRYRWLNDEQYINMNRLQFAQQEITKLYHQMARKIITQKEYKIYRTALEQEFLF